MSSTSNDFAKVFKQMEKLSKELSLATGLIVSMQNRLDLLEEGGKNNGEKGKNNNNSFPPFVLNGPKGYKEYLQKKFRQELDDRFSSLQYIQPMR
jgi:hypothetical protein